MSRMIMLLGILCCSISVSMAQSDTPTPTAAATSTPTPTPLPALSLTITDDGGGVLNYNWGDSFVLNYTVNPKDNDFTDFSATKVAVYLYLYFPDGSIYPFDKTLTLTDAPYYVAPTFANMQFTAETCGRMEFKTGVAPQTGEYRYAGIIATQDEHSNTYTSQRFVLNRIEGPTPTPTPTATTTPRSGLNLHFTKSTVPPGDTAVLHYTIEPITGMKRADIYLRVETPDGTFLFFDKRLRPGSKAMPIVRNLGITNTNVLNKVT